MKSLNFLVSAFCLAVLLNHGAMAEANVDSSSLPRDDHIAELKQLEAWCPLDHTLTGLDLGYCDKEKVVDEDKGPLLQASEARARKVLFGTSKKGQECGLCSASMEKKGCSTTKSGIKVSFDVAIKADNYSMLRKWCLLGKANMELCRNFGSESLGLEARTQMCHDLKAKKFALDPLRALEFGAGEDEPLSAIIKKLGQNKVYSLLGLGGCLTLLEEKPVLVPVFRKLRPDACAIICVKALADPKEPVLDVVASVYRGFVKTGNEIVSRHKKEFVKTNVVKVLKRIKGMVTNLDIRQVNYTTTEKNEKVKVFNLTKKIDRLQVQARMEKEAFDNYTKRAEEWRKRYRAFKSIRGSRVVLPPASSDTQGQRAFVKEGVVADAAKDAVDAGTKKPVPVKSANTNSTESANSTKSTQSAQIGKIEIDEAKLHQIIRDAVEKQRLADQGNMTKMKERLDMERTATASRVSKAEDLFKEETRKIRPGEGYLSDSQKLKSQ